MSKRTADEVARDAANRKMVRDGTRLLKVVIRSSSKTPKRPPKRKTKADQKMDDMATAVIVLALAGGAIGHLISKVTKKS